MNELAVVRMPREMGRRRDGLDGANHESTGFGEEDLPALQGDPAQACDPDHLQGSAAQAAARLGMFERPLRRRYPARGRPGRKDILDSRCGGHGASEQILAMATGPGARRDQFEFRF
jgi:hypothetical protein